MTKVIESRKARGGVSSDYLKLISELPLRPLKSKSDFAAAQSILDRLVGREDLSEGQLDYIAALARFVQDYEREHRQRKLIRLSTIDMLKFLMEESDMNTSDLGYILGSRGLASEVLNGKRDLSKALIRKLSAHFGLPASLFLNEASGHDA